MNREPAWDLYRTFAAVLSERSLSGAARMLGLTQPTVARHIDALEQAVGVDLFLRSQRGLDPTEAALALKPYADTMVTTAAALLRTASSDVREVTGTVRISASDVVGVEHLPPILASLRQQHPKLGFELALSDSVHDLLQREADIALRMVEPQQDALVAKRVGSLVVGLHAHRSYLDQRGAPASLDELGGYDLIGFDQATPGMRAAMAKRLPSLTRAMLALRADSNLAQLAAIRAGFGIGFCQVVLAQRESDLVRVLVQEVAIEFGLWVVMHEDLRTSPRCRVVFDALVDGLKSLC